MKLIVGLIFAGFFSTHAFAIECSGTEPFWGAKISADKIAVDMFGETSSLILPVTSVTGAWGYTADFLKIYSNDNGHVAVVTSNKCSDSMSDLEYPNEIIIFTGTGTLYGCCGQGVATGEGI